MTRAAADGREPVPGLQRLRNFGARYIDYGMAWKGALFLGLAVWGINLEHGALAALPAALKQATYSFFVAGFIMRLCENIAAGVGPRPLALFLAVLIPSCLALGLTLLVHTLRGTPEPLWSVLPTLLTAPPAFLWWGSRKRKVRDESTAIATTS